MAANDLNIKIVYETGSFEVITSPDVSFGDDFCHQSEYVDLSDPDAGIFWERSAVFLSDPGDLDSDDPELVAAARNPWRAIHQRTCVVPPENLAVAAAVFVCGVRALVRMPRADTKCGLVNVLLESMVGSGGVDAADISDYVEVGYEDLATD